MHLYIIWDADLGDIVPNAGLLWLLTAANRNHPNTPRLLHFSTRETDLMIELSCAFEQGRSTAQMEYGLSLSNIHVRL